jgi:hypothetical protein
MRLAVAGHVDGGFEFVCVAALQQFLHFGRRRRLVLGSGHGRARRSPKRQQKRNFTFVPQSHGHIFRRNR